MADTTNEFRYIVFKVKNTHATDPKSCLPNSRTRSIENGRYSFVFIKSNKLGPSFSKTCELSMILQSKNRGDMHKRYIIC